MRVVAVLIVLYFVSSVAFAQFGDMTFKEPTAADASQAGKDAQKESIKLVEGNVSRDEKRAKDAIAKSTISINPGGVSGLDNFSIQSKDLAEVKDGIQKQYDKCTAICLKAIAAAEKALEKAKAIPCVTKTDNAGNTSEDCSKRDGEVSKANIELQAAKDALKLDCQDPLTALMEKVKAMKVVADNAAKQAKKVKDASQGFGGGGSSGSGGKDPKPGEVVVECLKGVAYMNPACDNFFLKYCQSNPDEPVCANWANHYCGLDFAAGSPRPHDGAEMCITSTPYYFCKGHAENNACQSCKDLQTIMESKKNPYYSIEQIVANREACPNDPMLKHPSIIERLNAYDNSTPATGYQNQSLKPGRFK